MNTITREIREMCDPLDISCSLRFIYDCDNVPHSVTYYKIHVLSARDDIEYLGDVTNEMRIRSGNTFHLRNLPMDIELCHIAAGYGKLEVLKYLHENGCPWDDWVCAYAIAGGYLDCLRYAHENGCSWGSVMIQESFIVYMYRATNTTTKELQDCIDYLNKNGCPWNFNRFI